MMMQPAATHQSDEQRELCAADVDFGRKKAPELARRGFLPSGNDQTDTAATALAT